MTKTVALVTGANKGIGFATTAGLARTGATVLLGSRDVERGEHAAERLRAQGLSVYPLTVNVTDQTTVAAAAAEVEKQFGQLDVLVNNAGMTARQQVPGAVDLAAVWQVFETNVLGAIAVIEAMLPLLRRSPAARIVNVSSAVGSLAVASDPESPMAGLPASAGYAPSKTALTSVTVQYAKALRGAGILVNAADPGYCKTDLNGNTGYLTPEQGAAVVVRLATLDAAGPTGGIFGKDGPIPW